MLEADDHEAVAGQGVAYSYASAGCDDIGEELGLAPVLPRHTKVLVTGNNRTKSVLLGLHGVVKKAVGLGGWHWLVLTNGDQVKLQRNALSVIEAATGEEDDDDDIENNLFFSGNSLEHHDYPRAFKSSGQARKLAMPPSAMMSGTRDDHHIMPPMAANPAVFKHPAPFEKKADLNQGTTSPSSNAQLPTVDLSKLETAALRRYQKHFKLVEVGPHLSKEQLLDAVGKHFMSQELDEFQVITGFIQAAKRLKS